MKRAIHLEHRASSSRSKHEGEPPLGLCDRLDRTRDNSQRQLPTDHDYAVPTREYQTDQSSLKPAQAVARSVLGKKQRQPHRFCRVDAVTPYQANALIKSDVCDGALLLRLYWAHALLQALLSLAISIQISTRSLLRLTLLKPYECLLDFDGAHQ
jgi:hypothetical protein